MQPALRTLSKSFERHLLATNRSARTVQTYLCELESLERIEAQMKQENEAARVELTIVAQAPGLDTPAEAEVIELVSRWGDQLTDDKVAYGTGPFRPGRDPDGRRRPGRHRPGPRTR